MSKPTTSPKPINATLLWAALVVAAVLLLVAAMKAVAVELKGVLESPPPLPMEPGSVTFRLPVRVPVPARLPVTPLTFAEPSQLIASLTRPMAPTKDCATVNRYVEGVVTVNDRLCCAFPL